MGPAPDFPAMRFSQNPSVLLPRGETTPVPVINTRRSLLTKGSSFPGGRTARSRGRARKRRAGPRRGVRYEAGAVGSGRRARVRLEVVHRVAHGLELVRF